MKHSLPKALATLLVAMQCSHVLALSCEATASNQQARYDLTAADCGSASKPAFLCTGVILRAAKSDQLNGAYDAWDVSKTSKKTAGTSFSYLRADANFARLVNGQNSGYTLMPILNEQGRGTPAMAAKTGYQVLCSFPVDGGTNSRGYNGCGTYQGADSSRQCHAQSVTTGAQWVDHYKKNVTYDNRYACAFSVRDDLNRHASTNFTASLEAMRAGDTFSKQNELRVANWQDGVDEGQLPIESFFYLSGDADGLRDARFEQTNYFRKTGVYVPIIAMSMPKAKNGKAQFACKASDQVIAEDNKGPANKYVQSGEWVKRHDPGTGKEEWTLSLTLTELGVAQRGSSGSDAVYAEMLAKFGEDPQWTQNDGGGMRRQLVCHFVIARNKREFNLEPFRPNVSEEQAEKANCNPI